MASVNQRSQGTLLTTVVIFAILFVTATVFAIYYGTRASKAEKDLADEREKIQPEIVQSVNDPSLTDLRAARDSGKIPGVVAASRGGSAGGTPLINVALAQRDQLAQAIGGSSAASFAVAREQAQAAIESAKSTKAYSGDSLAGAVTAMANQINTLNDQLAQSATKLANEQAAHKAAIDTNAAELSAMRKEVADVRAQADKSMAAANSASNDARQTVQTVEQARADERAKVQAAMDQQSATVAGLNSKFENAQKVADGLQNRLDKYRVNPGDATLVQTDGQIVSIPGNGMVYINLGSGKQVVPGLTFEVYDQGIGMPRKTEVDETGDPVLPKGKAAIEVVRVGGSSSEARIIRQDTGTILAQGDLIANLVYDQNTKYNFVVYGKFDLDQNEKPTQTDAEVIKRLITQWGGKVSNDVSVSTDFVVLGSEPELPQFSREELQDVLNVAKLDAAQREVDAYQDVVQKARELGVPVLNQNRFLYFIGYYNLATR